MGAYLGAGSIPYAWIRELELAELFILGVDRMLALVR
jgi:hypothetical protein